MMEDVPVFLVSCGLHDRNVLSISRNGKASSRTKCFGSEQVSETGR